MNANTLGANKIDSSTGNGTKSVKVVEPCTCGAKFWFLCECALIAEYEVQLLDTVPNPAQLTWIHNEHPDKTLIY